MSRKEAVNLRGTGGPCSSPRVFLRGFSIRRGVGRKQSCLAVGMYFEKVSGRCIPLGIASSSPIFLFGKDACVLRSRVAKRGGTQMWYGPVVAGYCPVCPSFWVEASSVRLVSGPGSLWGGGKTGPGRIFALCGAAPGLDPGGLGIRMLPEGSLCPESLPSSSRVKIPGFGKG